MIKLLVKCLSGFQNLTFWPSTISKSVKTTMHVRLIIKEEYKKVFWDQAKTADSIFELIKTNFAL